MTLETFLRKLRKTPRRWKVNADARIRCRTKCPVEVVAGVQHGLLGDAKRKLELPGDLLSRIVTAADCSSVSSLRTRLLKACGLSHALRLRP